MLQVTLNTSLKLHGRTTELPWSDFNRQVIRFTRHTIVIRNVNIFQNRLLVGVRNKKIRKGSRMPLTVKKGQIVKPQANLDRF